MEKFTLKCIQTTDAEEYRLLGVSLLTGKFPLSITDNANGERPITKVANPNAVDETAPRLCTDTQHFDNHMDILCDSADIIYDIGKVRRIDKIYVASMSTVIHALADFSLFLSETQDTLFDESNFVYRYKRGENEEEAKAIDWLLTGNFGEKRYFGIRINKASTADDIIRIGQIGLFNADFTANTSYLSENYTENLIADCEPKCVTDKVLYEDTFEVCGEHTFAFTFENATAVNKAVIICDADFCAKADNFNAESISGKTIDGGLIEKTYSANNSDNTVNSINITLKGDCKVHQIVLFSDYKRAKVDFSNVINNDFYSVGACLMPMAFMPESIASGYNEAYWQLEECRIRRAKPTVVRVWFQVDWVVDEYENYKNGIYSFDNQKMYSVYKYFDVFKEIGTEIEFDFGWKISAEAQPWFSLKDVIKKNCSAPAELDLFAKCCAATLEELIKNRGYDNIKYLTFYNEPDHVDLDKDGNDGYDFLCYGTGLRRKEYWRRMLVACKEEIAKKNIDIKYWGCEVSSSTENQKEFTEYFTKEHTGLLDMVTTHRYMLDTDGADIYFKEMLDAANGLPAMLTECGQIYDKNMHSYNKNSVQLFCDNANNGYSGMLIWCICGMRFTMPSNFLMNNAIDFWHTPQIEGGIDRVLDNYYYWAFLSSYVPNHSKTVKSVFNKKELRVAAFTHNDDYTVVVELPAEGHERTLDIKLAAPLNKKLYKYTLERPFKKDGNALLPSCCGEVFADTEIKDTLSGNYQEIVYSTIPPVTQVKAPVNEVFLKVGETYELSGEVIDGDGDVKFEIAVNLGDFKLDGNKITLPTAKAGDMCAVKVISENNPQAYAVVIVKAAK